MNCHIIEVLCPCREAKTLMSARDACDKVITWARTKDMPLARKMLEARDDLDVAIGKRIDAANIEATRQEAEK